MVSPIPYGTCTDIEAIAEVCQTRGKPLIVDEAWGAHLSFHEDLPAWAMDTGSDVCVVSVHKMGTGFERDRSSTSRAIWWTPIGSQRAPTC